MIGVAICQNTIKKAQRRATTLGRRQTARDEEAGRILLGEKSTCKTQPVFSS